MELLSVYESVLGEHPTAVRTRPYGGVDSLGALELVQLLDAWQERRSTAETPHPWTPDDGHPIWPLVSHHNFHARSPFSEGEDRAISDRALRMLLIHEGVVLSDPFHEVADVAQRFGKAAAVERMRSVTARLAYLEPLIDRRYLKFTTDRPTVASDVRAGVLEALEVRRDFKDFTDLREISSEAIELGGDFARDYLWIATDLLQRLGESNELPHVDSFPTVRSYLAQAVGLTDRRLGRLAQAIIHLSWQLAVSSGRPDADIATNGDIEMRLFTRLLSSSGVIPPERAGDPIDTRHVQRTAIGDIPNLDGSTLSVADVVAIREDPAYEQFRDALREALDDYDERLAGGTPDQLARARFTQQMADASAQLRDATARTSIREYIKREWFTASVSVVVSAASVPLGVPAVAAVTGTGAVAQAIWHWVTARKIEESNRARPSVRFLASLGSRTG